MVEGRWWFERWFERKIWILCKYIYHRIYSCIC